jgi:translation initiation factor eIF-2B subunit epsilon
LRKTTPSFFHGNISNPSFPLTHPHFFDPKNNRRTCEVGNNTLIGSATHVSDNARIVASVIGKSCVIGAGSVVRDSYIFDGTSIGSGCLVERSIIGAGVSIKEKSTVSRGCLIGDGVVLGPGAMLKPFERLSTKKSEAANIEDGDEDEEWEEVEASKANTIDLTPWES